VEQDVARLDVPVDDVLAVRVVQGAGDGLRYVHGFLDRKLTFPLEPFPDGLSFQVRHDVVQKTVGFTRVVQRQDMGVLQVRRRLDLGEEPLGPDDSGQLWLEHLQRDLPLVLQVVGKIYRGHASLTELSLDVVAPLQGSVQACRGVGHDIEDGMEVLLSRESREPLLPRDSRPVPHRGLKLRECCDFRSWAVS
jgi:hypothetical protein